MGPIKLDSHGRPYRFRFEENGELYCIGSEVGMYLKVFRGHLYKKYPALTRRTVTVEERKKLVDLGLGKYSTVSQVTLLKAEEVDDILEGNDELYKRAPGSSLPSEPAKFSFPKEPKPKQISQFGGPGLGGNLLYSIHLDPVPQATQVSRSRPENLKKGRLFPICIDDLDPKIVDENASQKEELVPIRIELDIDGVRVRDTFTWNRNESLISPEEFGENLCYDLGLNPSVFVPPITNSIKQQIAAAPPIEKLNDSERVALKLNIQIGNVSLVDQIEWDLSETSNCPEKFAVKLCAELGLGGEFITAIAYSIRGQLSWHQKAGGGLPLEPPITKAFRNPSDADKWAPFVETLSEAELEKKIRDQDRHIRRVRRVAF